MLPNLAVFMDYLLFLITLANQATKTLQVEGLAIFNIYFLPLRDAKRGTMQQKQLYLTPTYIQAYENA